MIERLSLIVTEAVAVVARDLKGVVTREDGQGVTEYAIAIGFVAVAVAFLLLGLQGALNTFFTTVGSDLSRLPNAL